MELRRQIMSARTLADLQPGHSSTDDAQEPELSCAMKRLHRIVDELDSIVISLVARLDPVLQPPLANPAAQSAAGVRAVHSPLGDMVQNESDRIAAIRGRIEEALSRLAV